jgi:F0F1-type ATP synthase membrane subunit c/vacuolar-type H+-ATPase subunit K
MSDLKVILKKSKAGLSALAAALLVGAAAIAASLAFRDQTLSALAAARQAEDSTKSVTEQKEQSLKRLTSEIERYRVLEKKGLVGVPDRTGWTEQFLASQKQLAIPDSLTYTLQPPKPLVDQENAAASPAEPTNPDAPKPPTPLMHDLEFALTGTHEAEVLKLIQDYQARVNGRFRVNNCTFGAPTPKGMSANCTLRFYTLAEAKPPAAKP